MNANVENVGRDLSRERRPYGQRRTRTIGKLAGGPDFVKPDSSSLASDRLSISDALEIMTLGPSGLGGSIHSALSPHKCKPFLDEAEILLSKTGSNFQALHRSRKPRCGLELQIRFRPACLARSFPAPANDRRGVAIPRNLAISCSNR
jgi:hypothetical protein